MSRDDNSPSSIRRAEYLAEYWQDQTIVSNEEVILQHPQELNKPKKNKKKKSRGNRQLQRSRAKLRKQEGTTTATKRKRNKITKPGVTTSVSEISLMQPSTKRIRPAITTTTTTTAADVQINVASNKKPDYLHVNDQIFKKLLSTAVEGIDPTSILTLLDTSEKLQYARTYAQLVNDLFYLKMKDDYWKYYHTTIMSGLNPQIKKEKNILKKQQNINERLQQIEYQLNEHKQQHTVDNLSIVIPAFVRRGQHKLLADFERKKLLLQYDANDHCLLNAFDNLQPSTDQVCSAKFIWQATIHQQQNEEYLAIIKKRISTKRFPVSYNLLDHSIDPDINKMLKNSSLPVDKRITFSTQYEKIISRCKYELLTMKISMLEELIRTHHNMITNEKKKLTDAIQGTLLNAIEARQSNIIKRAQLVTKHKLSFFDYAPMITEEKQEEQEIIGANI